MGRHVSTVGFGLDIYCIQSDILALLWADHAGGRRFSKKGSELILPSLILIDGGYTHIKAVRKVLDRLSVEGVSLLAISKGARRKPEMDLIHTETGKKLSLR